MKTNPEQSTKIDEELENGPIDKRECRDILCCLLFLIHGVAMVVAFSYGLSNGNPIYLTGFCAGYNNGSNTNVTQCAMFCGAGSQLNPNISDAVKNNYKYLYYPNPFNMQDILNGKGVCVQSCPNQTLGLAALPVVDGKQPCLYQNTFFNNCGEGLSSYSQELQNKSSTSGSALSTSFSSSSLQQDNMFLVYNSTPFLGRICVPQNKELMNASAIQYALNSLGTLTKGIQDLVQTYQAILITAGFALFVAYIYMVFLRFCSGVIIWIMILTIFVLQALLGYFFYNKGTLNPPTNASADTNQMNTYIGYTIFGIDVLFVLFVCCMFSRIRLAIAIIKTATMFVRDTWSAMVVPLIFYIKIVIFFVFWIVGFIYIYSIGDPQKSTYGPIAAFQWGSASYQQYTIDTRYVLLWWVFAGLWCNAFLGALLQLVLASAVAIWYFSQGKAHAPVSRSYYRAFRYHFGSIAFGSFILAVVQFIRVILTYIQNKINSRPELKNNVLIKVLMCCLQCYFWCLEKCIKFLNKNAYIQIAIGGKSFCGAAKDAFFIILKNPARMTAVAGVGGIFIGLGKLIISSVSTFGGYLLITQISQFDSDISSPVFPVIFMFLISWNVALIIMSVYGMAADTILMCFLIDEELNKEKGRSPQFSPEPLREFLSKAEKTKK